MVLKLINFAGSLCVLLYGMKLMSDGIQKGAGQKLQKALAFVTGNRFVGLLTGMILTMIIQSSGATTVMVVTFVNAGLMTLQQSIGVIFGANIGTTVTGWIVALFGFNFKMETLAVPIFGIGYLLTVNKRIHKEGFGQALMGFALLFIGLGWLSSAFQLDADSPLVHLLAIVQGYGAASIMIGVVVGTIITGLLHSSSAMSAIIITMAYNKLVNWEFSAAMIIGSTIGSTIDAIMASFGAKPDAKRVALVHVLFNLSTAVIALIIFKPFLAFVDFITPTFSKNQIIYDITMLHTIFKVFGAIIFLPFVKQIVWLMNRLVKDDENALPTEYHLEFNERMAMESPEGCVFRVQKEMTVFADVVVEMFDSLQDGLQHPDKDFIENHFSRIEQLENYTDQMQDEIVHYLVRCSHLHLSDESKDNVSTMMQLAGEMESMADGCLNIANQIKKAVEKKMEFPKEDVDRLLPYFELARQLLYFIHKNVAKMQSLTQEQFEFASEIEQQIDDERRSLRKIARDRMEKGGDVRTELLYIDMVRQIEKFSDRCFDVAGELGKTVRGSIHQRIS
ncbi:MAG: Na/Pi cotransporter family protein [Treponema sp.]|nr:Na/Pi cotransporter family protein [Treponema sp.]